MKHEHAWLPRPDLGRAFYGCLCGAHARKRLATGAFDECSEPASERTVNFKPTGPRPQDINQHVLLSRTHTTCRGSTPIQLKFFASQQQQASDWPPPRQHNRSTPHYGGDGPLIQAAWLEWQVSWSFRTGLPPSGGGPPGWFIREELGFSAEHRPSLADTCRNLADLNRRALGRLAAVGGLDLPKRVTYPLNNTFSSPRNGQKRS